ncbi:MAG: choice-of-anchor Y domain-containing protein, partial [Anaerolineales bacterium]
KPASATSAVGGKTLVLYDAAAGALPTAPLMNFTDFPPGAASPAYANGMTFLDTTTSGNSTYAGWISNVTTTPGFPTLDRTVGFQLDFALQIDSESHTNNNRAGFSIIVLSDDARGIELAFWENEIWAQNDQKTGGLFRHGEGTLFATTTGLINYQVIVVNDTYTLTANTEPILTGPQRDYSQFEGFPDPYETPNFLFLGDDTTSAQARIQLGFVSITGTERPTPTTSASSNSATPPSVNTVSDSSATPAIKNFVSCER